MRLTTYLHLAILLLLANQGIAQDMFQISPTAFDTILLAENTNYNSYQLKSKMENLSNSDLEIEWVLEDIEAPAEWQISITDNDFEWAPSITTRTFVMEAAESEVNFMVGISSFGVPGCGSFKLSYRNFLTQEVIQTVNYTVGVDDENCLTTSTAQQIIPDFTISPNPSRDVVYLSTKADIESVEIYDSIGQLVQRIDHVASAALDLSSLNNGLYLVKVSDRWNRVSSVEVMKSN